MTKHADAGERRRQIAQAVWAIAATRGLEAATLRDVASEAGVSMGLVQHHFTSKERMLLYACEHLVELADEGMRQLVADSAEPASPRSVIRSVAVQTLPLTEQERLGASVWHAYLGRAVLDADLAAFIRRAWDGTHQLVADQLRTAQRRGELAEDIDPEQDSTTLLSLVDGLVSHLLVGHRSPQEALSTVDVHLDRLFR